MLLITRLTTSRSRATIKQNQSTVDKPAGRVNLKWRTTISYYLFEAHGNLRGLFCKIHHCDTSTTPHYLAFHSIHNSTIHVAYIHASEIPVMGWIILIINNLIILSELSLFNSHMCVLVVCKGPLSDPLGDILVKSPLCPREPCVPLQQGVILLPWFQGV